STARRLAACHGFRSRRSRPLRRIVPEALRSPDSALRKVVLPEPLGPTIAVTSPGRASNSTSCRMRLAPNDTETLSASIIVFPLEIQNPAPAQQDPQEEGRADGGGDDADRQFGGGDDGAADRVRQ